MYIYIYDPAVSMQWGMWGARQQERQARHPHFTIFTLVVLRVLTIILITILIYNHHHHHHHHHHHRAQLSCLFSRAQLSRILRAQQRHHPIYIYIFVCIHTIIYLCACSSYRYKLYNCIGNYIIHYIYYACVFHIIKIHTYMQSTYCG